MPGEMLYEAMIDRASMSAIKITKCTANNMNQAIK